MINDTLKRLTQTTPYINLSSIQETFGTVIRIQDNTFIADEAYSDGPGWLVVLNTTSTDDTYKFGDVEGVSHLEDGLNEDIQVNLDSSRTCLLTIMLYTDNNVVGVFDQNDIPYEVNSEFVGMVQLDKYYRTCGKSGSGTGRGNLNQGGELIFQFAETTIETTSTFTSQTSSASDSISTTSDVPGLAIISILLIFLPLALFRFKRRNY
ncbi:MAG: DUF7282 domain-containing protein [Candidatus Hodarchaeales archaeon]